MPQNNTIYTDVDKVTYNEGWEMEPLENGKGFKLTATGSNSDATIERDGHADVPMNDAPAGTTIIVQGSNAAVTSP